LFRRQTSSTEKRGLLGRTPEGYAAGDIEKDILFHEDVFVVTGVRNPWVRRRRISLADLANEKWVVTNAAFEPMPRVFAILGLPVPHPSIAAHSAFLRNAQVASGEFLAVLSSPQLVALRNQVRCRSSDTCRILHKLRDLATGDRGAGRCDQGRPGHARFINQNGRW
jgi:hypothetical protein